MRLIVNPSPFPWMELYPPFQLPYSAWAASSATSVFEARPFHCANHNVRWHPRMPLRHLLLCAGVAQSPSTVPTDLSAWGFLVEHVQSFASRNGMLRVVDSAESWDSRARALFAERLGMGLTAWLLWQNFSVVHIADAGPFIGRTLVDPSSPYDHLALRFIGAEGEMRPDYFCLSNHGEAVIVESKGAIGAPSAVTRQERLKAKQQVRNVTPVGVAVRAAEGRITFATNIRTESDKPRSAETDTGVRIEDPDGDDDSLRVTLSADEVTVAGYCKFLQFIGLGWVTPCFRQGIRPLVSPDFAGETIMDESVTFLAGALGLRVGLLTTLVKVLFIEEAPGLHRRVSAVLNESALIRMRREFAGEILILPNGIVAVSAV